jgi:protoporphyrinogen oxidase
MSADSDLDAIVVGGGISGLACAWGLQKRRRKVVVLETASRAGGTMEPCASTAFFLSPDRTAPSTPTR